MKNSVERYKFLRKELGVNGRDTRIEGNRKEDEGNGRKGRKEQICQFLPTNKNNCNFIGIQVVLWAR